MDWDPSYHVAWSKGERSEGERSEGEISVQEGKEREASLSGQIVTVVCQFERFILISWINQSQHEMCLERLNTY